MCRTVQPAPPMAPWNTVCHSSRWPSHNCCTKRRPVSARSHASRSGTNWARSSPELSTSMFRCRGASASFTARSRLRLVPALLVYCSNAVCPASGSASSTSLARARMVCNTALLGFFLRTACAMRITCTGCTYPPLRSKRNTCLEPLVILRVAHPLEVSGTTCRRSMDHAILSKTTLSSFKSPCPGCFSSTQLWAFSTAGLVADSSPSSPPSAAATGARFSTSLAANFRASSPAKPRAAARVKTSANNMSDMMAPEFSTRAAKTSDAASESEAAIGFPAPRFEPARATWSNHSAR
mmetsp:Transcript_32681/g.84724  ORF Transcript_32681/g.84724 Transcript_32681/m.84724 type:complete len:295 (+) Transcript_32681:2068-2952(+)